MFQGPQKGCNLIKQNVKMYMETHISHVRHHETTIQLVRASKRNIIICYREKICIKNKWVRKTELNRSAESESCPALLLIRPQDTIHPP